MSLLLIAQAAEEHPKTLQDFNSHLGNLVFTGVFLLALLVAGIWWLKRNS